MQISYCIPMLCGLFCVIPLDSIINFIVSSRKCRDAVHAWILRISVFFDNYCICLHCILYSALAFCLCGLCATNHRLSSLTFSLVGSCTSLMPKVKRYLPLRVFTFLPTGWYKGVLDWYKGVLSVQFGF